MKRFIFAVNLIILTTSLAIAQDSKFKKNPNDIPEPNSPAKSVKDTKAGESNPESSKSLLNAGTVLDAKLLNSLNVKKTEVGDEVVLKVTKSVKQDGEVVVPKGTKLIGRITEVQKKSKEDKSSKLGMVFETLQNKNLSAPITASIVSISSAAGNVQAGDLFAGGASGSSSSTGSSSSGSGGGLLGGATSAAGGVLGGATSTVGGVANTAGGTLSGATPLAGRALNGVVLTQSLDANVAGSSTLTAENKNIKLEKGTQFRVQLNQSVQE